MASIGGIPQEDLIQMLVDKMQLDDTVEWNLTELIQRYVNSGLWISDIAFSGGIANSEYRIASPLALSISPTLTVIPGTVCIVPPTTRDVWLKWKALVGISVAGQGAVILNPYEIAITGVSTALEASVTHVSSTDPVTLIQDTQESEVNIGPSEITRVFTLYGSVIREAGSALEASLFNGDGPNKTYMRAVAE